MVNEIIDHELPYPTLNTYDVIFFKKSIHTVVTYDPGLPNLLAPPLPGKLFDFLKNHKYNVGVEVKEDLKKLKKDHKLGSNTKTVDLSELAAKKYGHMELKNWGLKALASLVMEKEMEKPKRKTTNRWDSFWLTSSQVRYACIDAYVSFKIGELLIFTACDSSS
ncbi:hypothetical protein ACS0TY_020899 [Phlomoides rotata]